MPFVLWTAIIAALFCVVLGIFVFVKNPNSLTNRSFAFFNLALAAWIPSDLIKNIQNHQMALIVYRLCYVGGSFITFAFLMFMWAITTYENTRIYRIIKWSAMIFAILSQTGLMIKDIHLNTGVGDPIEEIHGPLYMCFTLFFVFSLLYSVMPLILGYKKSNGIKRKQLQHIMFSFFLGFVAVINFFANQAIDKIPPLFYIFVMGISATFATAIMKHRLMDITVIIRKTLVYSTVMVSLTIGYLGIISVFAHVFQGLAGYQTMFSSIVAACLVALGFQPLRKRVQASVDKRFFRQYVDREQKLFELSREVVTHATPEAMGQAFMRVINETLHPKSAVLYLKSKNGMGFSRAASIGNNPIPELMREDNALATYFIDHPQPFVNDSPGEIAVSHDTRRQTSSREQAA